MKLLHHPFGASDAVVTGRFRNTADGAEFRLKEKKKAPGTLSDILSPVPGTVTAVTGGSLTVSAVNGLTVILSGLETVTVRTGGIVSAGVPIGSAGELILSVRRGEEAINPAELFGIANAEGEILPGERTVFRRAGCHPAPGDAVRIKNPVRYGTGHRFPADGLFEVLAVRGDRVTVGRGGFETAFVKKEDVEPVLSD